MTKIIELAVFVLFILLLIALITKLWKRIYLIQVMQRLGKVEGIKIKCLKNPFLSLFGPLDTAEYIVDIYDSTYLVRCYNGGGASKSVHFASDKFSVRYSVNRSYAYQPGVGRVATTRGIALGADVKIISPILPPAELSGREFSEVIIFNPAPSQVSFVVKEKNSIRAAFTGDEVLGRKIFTASTFEIFADREARRIRLLYQSDEYVN